MIDFQNIYKSYGAQELLTDTSFRINKGEHVGIVGANGSGKSTIFSLITEEIEADKGFIAIPKDLRIGYLRQHLDNSNASSSLIGYTEDAIPELTILQQKIKQLELELNSKKFEKKEKDSLLNRIGRYQTEFEHLGGYTIGKKAEAALTGLGFSPTSFSSSLSTFSGGWQMRAALARTLISDSDILLLDEPSNYLDIPAVEWLQKFLRNYQGTLLLISHDRYLLKTLTNITFEVNIGKVTRYAGDYDYYMCEREIRKQHLEARKLNQDKKIEQIEKFVDRFKYKASKANQVQSRIKMLDKLDRIALSDRLSYTGKLQLPPPPKCGNEIISMENAGLTYDKNVWVLKNIDLRIERGEKIGIIGYNGTGKTTLLRMLAGQIPLSSGKQTLGFNVIKGYQSQEFGEILSSESTVYNTVKSVCKDSSNIRSLLGSFGFPDENAQKQCEILSGGEKIRLLFARIFANPPNFLILDEPTTHLDIHARENLQEVLKKYKGTVCVVSHDVEFIRNVATTIIAMNPPGITKYFGGYNYYLQKKEQTENTAENTIIPLSNESSGNEKKLKRQQRAAIRQKYNSEKKQLDKKVNILEHEVERLDSEKEELHKKLIDSPNALDMPVVSRRLKEIDYELNIATENWENAALELEGFLDKYKLAMEKEN